MSFFFPTLISLIKRRKGSCSVLCRCDRSFSVCSSQTVTSGHRGLRGLVQVPGVSGQRRPPPTPRSPPAQPRQPTRQPATAAHIPASASTGWSPPNAPCELGSPASAGGRGPAGRPSWLELSIEPAQRPLYPASETDAAPASGTQRLNTPAAETRDGGREEFQVISETKREACSREKGIVAARRGR